MKSMFWELYHGNICGKDIRLPEKTRKEEFALYDKLKATLSEESDRKATLFSKSSSKRLPKAKTRRC